MTRDYDGNRWALPYVFEPAVSIIHHCLNLPSHRKVGNRDGGSVPQPVQHRTVLIRLNRGGISDLLKMSGNHMTDTCREAAITFRIVYPEPSG